MREIRYNEVMFLFTFGNLLLAVSALFYLIALGLAIVFSRRFGSSFTRRSQKVFIFFVFTSFSWFVFNTISIRTQWSPELTLFGIRGTLAVTSFLTVVLILFFNSIFKEFMFIKKKTENLLLAISSIIGILCFFPVIVASTTIVNNSITPNFGIAFPLYAFWILCTIIITGILLWRYTRIKEFSHQNKWLFIFWGFALALGTIILTNMFAVVVFKSDAGVVFGPSLMLIFVYICLYTIDASRIVDLSFALNIGLRYLLTSAGVVVFIIAAQILDSIFPDYQITIAIFAGVFIVLAARVITILTEPYTKYEKDTKSFINTISVELDLLKILTEIKKIVTTIVQVKEVSFVILNRDKSLTTYRFVKKGHIETSEILNRLFNSISTYWDEQGNDLIYVRESSSFIKNSSAKESINQTMATQNIFLVAPLNRRVTLNGAILLGAKSNFVEYTTSDIDLLEEVIQFSSVAISRALLYQETNTFAQKLGVEVKERTKELIAAQTDLESKNIQLKTAFHELKTLDNAKSEFISIASHQLRTPISIIKGYVSMVLEEDFGKVPEEQKVALTKTSDNIQQLNDIVEDILNASRIERGKLVITPEKGDVIELVKNVVAQLLPKADRKGLKLTFQTKIKTFDIFMDRNKIYEVVMNLVDNAINYTQEGQVSVSCETSKDNTITISVKDTGIGIPDEFKEKMFHRFSRSDNAKIVRPDGTGIGLYVAKSFIDAHKGQLWFESKLGKGTTFFVKLLQDPKLENEHEEALNNDKK